MRRFIVGFFALIGFATVLFVAAAAILVGAMRSTVTPLPGNVVKLFDETNDPGEFTNLAGRPDHRQDVDRYLALLVEHMRRTARLPEHVPTASEPLEFLDFAVQPRDALPGPQRK